MLLPELAAAPTSRAKARKAVACSSGYPKSNVASEPGVKKSMILPITQGTARLTPVETTKQPTPMERSRHWGFARDTSLMMEAVSETIWGAAGGDGEGATVTGGALNGVDGDAGEDEGVGAGGVGESGSTDSNFDVEELKRKFRKRRR